MSKGQEVAMTFFFGVLYWNDFPSEPWDQA